MGRHHRQSPAWPVAKEPAAGEPGKPASSQRHRAPRDAFGLTSVAPAVTTCHGASLGCSTEEAAEVNPRSKARIAR